MRRVKSAILVLLSVALTDIAYAQAGSPVLEFLGASSEGEVNPYDAERLEEYLSDPLEINLASEAGLHESGLLTRYQIASLTDYLARHGDIMSITELAALDGFSEDFASRLAPFISLVSYRPPSPSSVVRNDVSLRAGLKRDGPMAWGLKYRMIHGERLSAGLAVSGTSASRLSVADGVSGHLAWHFRRRPGKVMIGDFNARFGQGLALWNGMSFSGLTSASTFMRRSSGISASSSFTGGYALRGAAVEIGFGPMTIAAMTAVSGDKSTESVMPGVNLSWLFRSGQISMTHYADFSIGGSTVRIPDMKSSFDAAFCIRGADIFGELALDWVSLKLAALAGGAFPAGENVRLAVMLRAYPPSYSSSRSAAARSTTKCSNEYAASMAADFGTAYTRHRGSLSADFACFPVSKESGTAGSSRQLKVQGEWSFAVTEAFRSGLRVSERVRTWGEPFRTDLRADFEYKAGDWVMDMRINALHCSGTGFLTYLEGGYAAERLKVYLRSGLFRIDSWDDRIYVYERDAPGSFNVPAFYGRGVWGALAANWRFTEWGRLYLRAAVTSYPFMKEKKPGRAELKIQFVFRL